MSRVENHIVASLPLEDRIRLIALCERCSLVVSQVLSEIDNPSAHVYFPLDAIVSVAAVTSEKEGVGLALIGREGMLGSEISLGVSRLKQPNRIVVQGAGVSLRMSTLAFKQELVGNVALQVGMRSYVEVLMNQFSRSAACCHFHEIGPRLARWLLMSQDRSRSDSFHITHDFLAHMLGVRRVGITAAASQLQQGGLIQYHRGDLTILDRTGLKASACSCYPLDQKAWSKRGSTSKVTSAVH